MLNLLEKLRTSQLEGIEYKLALVFEDFLFKSKFSQFGTKVRISSNSLENLHTSHSEGAKYESDIGISRVFVQNLNLGKLASNLKS